jgi:hypothetical protein
MASMRLRAGEERYRAYKKSGGPAKGCPLCYRPAKQTFTHWKIIKNEFPYDRIASTHDMITPLAHITLDQVPPEAWYELQTIKKEVIAKQYDSVIEQMPATQSIPEHFHQHLIVIKDEE